MEKPVKPKMASLLILLMFLSSCKKSVNMQNIVSEVDKKVITTISGMDSKEFACKVFNPYYDFGKSLCFAVKTPRDDAAALIMAAVDGYVQTASWQDDYGALHTTYHMKHDPAYKIAFDVGHTGANGDLLKEQGIDPKVYRTTIMYIPPSKDK